MFCTAISACFCTCEEEETEQIEQTALPDITSDPHGEPVASLEGQPLGSHDGGPESPSGTESHGGQRGPDGQLAMERGEQVRKALTRFSFVGVCWRQKPKNPQCGAAH